MTTNFYPKCSATFVTHVDTYAPGKGTLFEDVPCDTAIEFFKSLADVQSKESRSVNLFTLFYRPPSYMIGALTLKSRYVNSSDIPLQGHNPKIMSINGTITNPLTAAAITELFKKTP